MRSPRDARLPLERSPERGLLSTEVAILMPIMLLVALLAVFVTQVERHSSRAQQAADAAARAASFSTSESEARAAAQAAAESVCHGTVVVDDVNFDFSPPALDTFTPGRVAVGLTCTEQFGAFAPLVSNTTRSESAVAVAAIEYWRPES